jgi:GDP-mannose 6-dehydrogenase
MNVAVFGLGYVGVVNMACLSKSGHKIYGCDIKPYKVDLINSGKNTILEPEVDGLLAEGLSKGLITCFTDAKTCIDNSEMAIICVGTPSDKDGNVNLNYILNTANDIARALKTSGKPYTIVFRSTIPPGTVQHILLPAVSKILNGIPDNLNVVFMPEFLREGSAVKDFFYCARIVAGLDENRKGESEIKSVFGFSDKIPLVFTNYVTAEFVKYVDNAYHATKVTFANEIYSIGSKLGVNISEANTIFLMDEILNISGKYLKPGPPFGGSCLPKDARAIVHLGRVADIEIPFFNGVLESNYAHQKRLLEKVLGFSGHKILVYGLTFKQNTDDIRESPFLFLLKDLVKRGKEVKVFDPDLNINSIRIDFPEIVKHIGEDISELTSWADIIVVNKPGVKEVAVMASSDKTILNCFDISTYKSVHNLF